MVGGRRDARPPVTLKRVDRNHVTSTNRTIEYIIMTKTEDHHTPRAPATAWTPANATTVHAAERSAGEAEDLTSDSPSGASPILIDMLIDMSRDAARRRREGARPRYVSFISCSFLDAPWDLYGDARGARMRRGEDAASLVSTRSAERSAAISSIVGMALDRTVIVRSLVKRAVR